VLDASALVELLLGTEQGRSIGARIADPTLGLHVPHLADVEVPTLVLAGELDRPEYVVSGRYLERKMPHARLEVIAGGEHSMHESTHAVDVAAAIEQFVVACDRPS